MENIHNYLSEIFDVPKDKVASCEKFYTTVHAKKGQKLLTAGSIVKDTFFVEKGLLRMFSIDDSGKEHIIQFAPENWLISDRSSIYFHEKSKYFIDAIEDSEVLLLSPDFFENLKKNFTAAIPSNHLLLHKHIRNLQNRVNSLLADSAEQRYINFMKMYPNLLQRVPLWMVASYLGITPESLSRVRRNISM